MRLNEIIDIKSPGDMALCEPDHSIQEAATLMKEHHCGNVIVVENRDEQSSIKGIVTDRDIALRCVAENRDPTSTKVRDIMTENPITFDMTEEDDHALDKMTKEGISRIIIIDEKKQARGVVTADDILKSKVTKLKDLSSLSKDMQKRENNRIASA